MSEAPLSLSPTRALEARLGHWEQRLRAAEDAGDHQLAETARRFISGYRNLVETLNGPDGTKKAILQSIVQAR